MSFEARGRLLGQVLAVGLSLASALVGQCQFTWLPGASAAGPDDRVYTLERLSNNDLIAGGSFRVVEGLAAGDVARFDGTTWSSLGGGVGGGLSSWVAHVVEMPNGDLIVGGRFTTAGGVPVSNIARWDGATWHPLGPGVSGWVRCMQLMPNGDLIVGGVFGHPSQPMGRVVRWDGASWSALGGGITGTPYCMSLDGNGNLLVGGLMPQGLARWDGANWSTVPGLDPGSLTHVHDLQLMPGGNLAMTGVLWIGQTLHTLAILSSAGAQPVASSIGPVGVVGLASNGDLLCAGSATGGSSSIGRFDGTSWSTYPGNLPSHASDVIEDSSGGLIVSGRSTGSQASIVTRTAGSWQPLTGQLPPIVGTTHALADSRVVVGGQFGFFHGTPANNVAVWNGTSWASLGSGVSGRVNALAEGDAGSIIVAGDFTLAGGAPANHIARWHNGAWSTLGAGLAASPLAIAANGSGEVMAIDYTYEVHYFDGQAWSPLNIVAAAGLMQGGSLSVVAMPNGDWVFGGAYQLPGGGFVGAVRYSAGVAQLIGTSVGPTRALALADDGELYSVTDVAGDPILSRVVGNSIQSIAPIPGLSDIHLQPLPGGDVLVAGQADGQAASVLRWNGAGWQSLPGVNNETFLSLSLSRSGELFAAGNFTLSTSQVSMGMIRAIPACPASVTTVGAGCVGAAGPMSLSAASNPWVGSTVRTTASGFPALSLGLHLAGTTRVAQPLPLGAPGCSLSVVPIEVALLLPVNGDASAPLTLPNDPLLVGQSLRTQVVGLELSPGLSLLRTTSSNALDMVVGML